jgi:cytochrome c peroxidase
MRTRFPVLWPLLLILAVVVAASCSQKPADTTQQQQPAEQVDQAKLALYSALPDQAPPAADDPVIALGRMLYYEKRLSKSHEISCNSCHDLANYGVDNQPTSDGHKGQRGDRNSPTVYNAAAHFAQFWDGRAPDVEAQAKGPVLNPVEMAMPTEKVVIATLESMPEYVDSFKKAFPGDPKPVSFDNMAKAIGAFERHLMTPSRWDAFLKGDRAALTPAEQAGLKLFTDSGCSACHNQALLGGNSYQKIGAVKPYPRADDPGRAKVTKLDSDRGFFKVPSLRNIEKTAPYMHDGKTPTLEQAVKEMGEYQLGRTLTDDETGRIVAFLKVLTAPIPADYIKEPALPRSTAKTPKPVLQ